MAPQPLRRYANDHESRGSELIRIARKVFEARQKRFELFPHSMLGETAWDMLLALYVFDHGPRRLTVSNLISFTTAAYATGLRWLDYLQNEGFIVREAHPTDRRASFVELTETARKLLDDYFSEMLSLEM
jgi:DNA-binding MarR family transcriptional regulator